MKQFEIQSKVNKLFANQSNIDATILIGSFGRNSPKGNSDIDYQLFVNNEFKEQGLLKQFEQAFGIELKYAIYLKDKKKWCFYLTEEYLVVEVFICHQLKELNKYFLGSEIENIEHAIVFDRSNSIYPYLQEISKNKKEHLKQNEKQEVKRLIISFQNRFESCSNAHFKSDGYKFHVLYSHALNALVRLIYLSEGAKEHDYMPPNFLTEYSYPLNLGIEQLGTMELGNANKQKRKLLDLFIQYLPIAVEKFGLSLDKEAIAKFLEAIYKRDYYWNFRDLSKFNTRIKEGVIYRSSALCLYTEKKVLNQLLKEKNITDIIDLRADRELKEINYNPEWIKDTRITHAPFDPWSQSVAFKNTYNTGSNAEIAYQFFSIECMQSIKLVVETILNAKGATCIHCHAGKDRTGIVMSLLHLLSETDEQTILIDYLASEMDTKETLIRIFLDEVASYDSAENYLLSCELTEKQITSLKEKISK